MHLPTYLVLMASTVVYGLYEMIILWQTNWFLFFVTVLLTLSAIGGGAWQSMNADEFQFKWMRIYTLPLGLLVVSGYLQNTEFSDSFIKSVGITPPDHIIPGTSKDYESAVFSHYVSIVFPALAWLLSWLVQVAIDLSWGNKRLR